MEGITMNTPTDNNFAARLQVCVALRGVHWKGELEGGELSVGGCCIKIYGGEFELRGKSQREGKASEQD